MSDFKVITDTTAQLAGRLNYLSDRHNVLAQNVAQIETPGYLSQDLTFEGFVSKENAAGATEFAPIARIEEKTADIKANGNNVSMEEEVGKLTGNSVEYLTAIEIIKQNISLMKLSVADK